MARQIVRVRGVAPRPDGDAEIAFAVHLGGGNQPESTVEYARGAAQFASASHAASVVQRFLDGGEKPPRFVVVATDGTIAA